MTSQQMAREAAEFVHARTSRRQHKQEYLEAWIKRHGAGSSVQLPIAEPPKPPDSPAAAKPATPLPLPPVLRGKVGMGASAHGVNCAAHDVNSPNPVPKPPEHQGREECAIQNDTNPAPSPAQIDWGPPDPNEYDVAGKLSQRQLIAIDLLVSGKNDREVAEAVGVKRVTVTRWRLYHLAFRAAVSRRRQQTFAAASDRLRNLLHKAIDVLEKQLASEDPKQQTAAIRLMIALSKQCTLQPPDEPECSREILRREVKERHQIRLAQEKDHPLPEPQDFEEAIAVIRERSSMCQDQESPAPKQSAIQNDTECEEAACAEANPVICPGTPASRPAFGQRDKDASENTDVQAGAIQIDTSEKEKEAGDDADVPGDAAIRIDTNPKLDGSAVLPLTQSVPGTEIPGDPSPVGVAM
jgi:hypothetical protein